jgi:3'-phosphoadenosine 5'-phosphosulfate (PAPS) 3'-phosphatase
MSKWNQQRRAYDAQVKYVRISPAPAQVEDWDVVTKSDESPLTKADLEANAIICNELAKLTPHIPIVSEENKQVPYSLRQASAGPGACTQKAAQVAALKPLKHTKWHLLQHRSTRDMILPGRTPILMPCMPPDGSAPVLPLSQSALG